MPKPKKESITPKGYTAKSSKKPKFTGHSKPIDFSAIPEFDMSQYLVKDLPAANQQKIIQEPMGMTQAHRSQVAASNVPKPAAKRVATPKTAMPSIEGGMIQEPAGMTQAQRAKLAGQQVPAAPRPAPPNLSDFPTMKQWSEAFQAYESKHGMVPMPKSRVAFTPPATPGQKLYDTVLRLFGRGGKKAFLPALAGGAMGAAAFGLPELAFAQGVGAPTLTPQQYGGTNIPPQMFRGFRPNPFMTIGKYGDPTQGGTGYHVPPSEGFDFERRFLGNPNAVQDRVFNGDYNFIRPMNQGVAMPGAQNFPLMTFGTPQSVAPDLMRERNLYNQFGSVSKRPVSQR